MQRVVYNAGTQSSLISTQALLDYFAARKKT
jgi:hypothetical protein